MLLLHHLLTLLLSTFIAAAPISNTTDCTATVFDVPWTLTAIRTYTPVPSSIWQNATVEFHFSDTNKRLEIDTYCWCVVKNGTCQSANGGYVMCEDSKVWFKYDRGLVMMERFYTDDCLGDYPYNGGKAFGDNHTQTIKVLSNLAGTVAIQDEMEVPITAMA